MKYFLGLFLLQLSAYTGRGGEFLINIFKSNKLKTSSLHIKSLHDYADHTYMWSLVFNNSIMSKMPSLKFCNYSCQHIQTTSTDLKTDKISRIDFGRSKQHKYWDWQKKCWNVILEELKETQAFDVKITSIF